jgi:hypothetical protein
VPACPRMPGCQTVPATEIDALVACGACSSPVSKASNASSAGIELWPRRAAEPADQVSISVFYELSHFNNGRRPAVGLSGGWALRVNRGKITGRAPGTVITPSNRPKP